MKVRLLITLAILTLAASLWAGETKRQTIVIRDGKLIESHGIDMDDGLLGGKRPFLGVSLMTMNPELREHFGGTKDSGVMIESVESGSPADKAGLRVGDLILSVDGKDVDNAWDLRSALREKKDGDTVRIELVRNRARQTVVATLVEREFPETRIRMGNLDNLSRELGERFSSPEWRARLMRTQNCDELQTKLKELETRMKDLEKKLK
ncbi:MAG TPA: PDZ domain-containing protein [Thermoanaerobaculia bacterium]|nr:PDZ domain-containing protein [Thermoanaerobaculia bacterium]